MSSLEPEERGGLSFGVMFFIVLMRDGTEWWIEVPTASGCLLPMKGFFRVAGLAGEAVNPSQSLPGVSSGSVSQA